VEETLVVDPTVKGEPAAKLGLYAAGVPVVTRDPRLENPAEHLRALKRPPLRPPVDIRVQHILRQPGLLMEIGDRVLQAAQNPADVIDADQGTGDEGEVGGSMERPEKTGISNLVVQRAAYALPGRHFACPTALFSSVKPAIRMLDVYMMQEKRVLIRAPGARLSARPSLITSSRLSGMAE